MKPTDDAVRARARHDHATSLVLEAGAGTGKTTLLVDRVESLVRTGAARLEEVAAVTFTENAATTLKLRIRERLDRARSDEEAPPAERERALAALESLERASISTIHALCATILQERPLECGLAPGIRMADDAEADGLFAEAWEEWHFERLETGDELLMLALDRDIPLEGFAAGYGERSSLRGLARVLVDQRDLTPLVSGAESDPLQWRAELDAKAREAGQLVTQVADGDPLAARLFSFIAFAEQARFLQGAALEKHLLTLPAVPKHLGQRRWWPSSEALDQGRALADWTKQTGDAWRGAHGSSLHARLVKALLGVVAIYERRKAARGVLDFLDLLMKVRNALRDRPSLRRYFRERYRYLIIDEFQDTDPLQVEIAHLLTGEEPGRLVVVGDAKQSIYRFRRAEVSLFRKLAEAARERPGHAVLSLTQNFRSRPAILRFVNRAFARLIEASDDAGQPAYEAIDPWLREGEADEPAVIALRFPAPSFADGDELLEAEAQALALLLRDVASGGREVRDPATGAVRPSRAGDVMVLARRLTKVHHLEEALEKVGLRFAVEGGKSFFDRAEVHEALVTLKALDDPSDRVSLVAALRSSFFGISDREIVSHHLGGGKLSLEVSEDDPPPSGLLAPALTLLRELHAGRLSQSVAALLERLFEETRILAALSGTRRGEAQSANLEKVVTLARQGTASLGALTLRGFINLLQERLQAAREEPDLPATRPGDPDTVRVLSIHKAKGLEAPVVALFDTADDNRVFTDVVPLWEERRVAIGFRRGCQPPGWDELVRRDGQKAWAEARRLLYVACTRARDWLVVPSPPNDARLGAFWRDLLSFLPGGRSGPEGVLGSGPEVERDVVVLDAETFPAPALETKEKLDLRALSGLEGGDALATRWDAERAALLQEASRRPFAPVSVSRVAAREAPPAVMVFDGTGRDFGALVHRVLEWVDLAAPEQAAGMAAALAPSFGLDAAAARRAGEDATRTLGLPLLERARRADRVWRELAVWFPDADELVEGVVDLVFEEDGGLVVLDYKTDQIRPEQALAQAAHHAPQLQLYGRGLARALGLPVRERLVLFTALGQMVPV